MFGLLMVDENLEVVEITFTVVTPWSLQYFLKIWMLSLVGFTHCCMSYFRDLIAGIKRFCKYASDNP